MSWRVPRRRLHHDANSVLLIPLTSVGVEDAEQEGHSELEVYPLLALGGNVWHPHNSSQTSQQLLRVHGVVLGVGLQRRLAALTRRGRYGPCIRRGDGVYLLPWCPLPGRAAQHVTRHAVIQLLLRMLQKKLEDNMACHVLVDETKKGAPR